jgi:hypothetical protein
MIDLISWPPRQYGVFKVKDQPFTWDEKEPFVTRKRDGKVDLDHTTPGFVNRILRYGKQNLIPPIEWHEEKIYSEIYEKIPHPLRVKFFRKVESNFPNMPTRPHNAPIPRGFAKAAKLDGVADDDPDLPMALARLSPENWLELLNRWLRADKSIRESKHIAGPAWWWAGHSVAMNPSPTINPLRFVGQWIGTFPCRHCRIESRRYVAKFPVPGWGAFEQWVSDFHNYVTSRKR